MLEIGPEKLSVIHIMVWYGFYLWLYGYLQKKKLNLPVKKKTTYVPMLLIPVLYM